MARFLGQTVAAAIGGMTALATVTASAQVDDSLRTAQVAALSPAPAPAATRPLGPRVTQVAQARVIDLDQDLATLSQEDLRQAFEDGFQALLRAPQDIGLLLRFVAIAVELEEYETAVGQLERLLLISPDLSVARAQLGILYFRLGSFEVAANYLAEALADGDLDPSVRAAAETALGASQSEIVQFDVSAVVTVGMRYQSNANAGPIGDTIVSRGQRFAVTGQTDVDDDMNGFLAARIDTNYDFLRQNELAFDAALTLYGTWHVNLPTLNVAVADLDAGFEFKPFPVSVPQLTVRPHGVANVLMVDNIYHSHAIGGGIDIDYELGDRTLIQGSYEFRKFIHDDTRNSPSNEERTGSEHAYTLQVIRQLTPRSLLVGSTGYSDRSTRTPWTGYFDVDVDAQFIQLYDAPFDITDEAWRGTVFGGFSYAEYGGPDPDVTADERRQDEEYSIGLRNTFAIVENVGVNAEYSYSRNFSNIPNYDRENHRAVVSATVRF